MGGATYLRNLRAPLAGISLIPTGGIDLEETLPLLSAGATAIGLGSSLFPASEVAAGNWDAIEQRAATIAQAVASL